MKKVFKFSLALVLGIILVVPMLCWSSGMTPAQVWHRLSTGVTMLVNSAGSAILTISATGQIQGLKANNCTLTTPLAVTSGGTGDNMAFGARSNLGIASYPKPPIGQYALPATFSNPLGIAIRYDGEKFQTNYSVYDLVDFTKSMTSYNSYYVSYATGNNSKAGSTPALAWQTLTYALAHATSPAVVNLLDQTCGVDCYNATTTTINGKYKINGNGPKGFTSLIPIKDSYTGTFSWTDETNGAYSINGTKADLYRMQFDARYIDEISGPTPITIATNATTCISTAGTYYYDAGGDKLYVHMKDGRAPDSDWLYSYGATKLSLVNSNNTGVTLLENLWVGSNDGTSVGAGVFSKCAVKPNLSKFGMSKVLSYGSGDGAVAIEDYKIVALENSHTRYSRADGFNYHSGIIYANATGHRGDYMTVYEVDDTAMYAGYTGFANQTALGWSENPTSAHDAINVLRINGKYGVGHGPVVADVGSVYSLNYGVSAGQPGVTKDQEVSAGNGAAWAATYLHDTNSTYGHYPIMVLVGCSGDSSDDYYTVSNDHNGTVSVQYWQSLQGQIYGTVTGF